MANNTIVVANNTSVYAPYNQNNLNIPPTYIQGWSDGHDMSKWNQIKKVIYNDPATIIYWEDGSKTVVKCIDGEPYDPEKGILYCIAKQFFGESFHRQLRQHCWDTDMVKKRDEKIRDLSELKRLLP